MSDEGQREAVFAPQPESVLSYAYRQKVAGAELRLTPTSIEYIGPTETPGRGFRVSVGTSPGHACRMVLVDPDRIQVPYHGRLPVGFLAFMDAHDRALGAAIPVGELAWDSVSWWDVSQIQRSAVDMGLAVQDYRPRSLATYRRLFGRVIDERGQVDSAWGLCWLYLIGLPILGGLAAFAAVHNFGWNATFGLWVAVLLAVIWAISWLLPTVLPGRGEGLAPCRSPNDG